jgi:hypothetical protein
MLCNHITHYITVKKKNLVYQVKTLKTHKYYAGFSTR